MKEAPKKTPLLGIDLGTSACRVAVYRGGKSVEVLSLDGHQRHLSSFIAFSDYSRLLGDEAKRAVCADPLREFVGSAVYSCKRLLGLKWGDEQLGGGWGNHLPYKLVPSDFTPELQIQHESSLQATTADNPCPVAGTDTIEEEPEDMEDEVTSEAQKKEKPLVPMVLVKLWGETKLLSAEEVNSILLIYLKEIAEEHLHSSISEVVLTVPSTFTQVQKQALKDACSIAGFSGVHLIQELSAVGLAFMNETPLVSNIPQPKKIILIFNMGGGFTEASLICADLNAKSFETIASWGRSDLGGEDMERELALFLAARYLDKSGKDVRGNKRMMMALKLAAEAAKKELTYRSESQIFISKFCGEDSFEYTLTREDLNATCDKIFTQSLAVIESVMKKGKIRKEKIDDYVLVGGCTRIPKVKSMITDYFNGLPNNQSVNIEESAAIGSALYGALKTNQYKGNGRPLSFTELSFYTFCFPGHRNVAQTLFSRNTVLPNSTEMVFSTCRDAQSTIDISLFEGDKAIALDNPYIATHMIHNVPMRRQGTPRIVVNFSLDHEGCVTVKAKSEPTVRDLIPGTQQNTKEETHKEIATVIPKSGEVDENETLGTADQRASPGSFIIFDPSKENLVSGDTPKTPDVEDKIAITSPILIPPDEDSKISRSLLVTVCDERTLSQTDISSLSNLAHEYKFKDFSTRLRKPARDALILLSIEVKDMLKGSLLNPQEMAESLRSIHSLSWDFVRKNCDARKVDLDEKISALESLRWELVQLMAFAVKRDEERKAEEERMRLEEEERIREEIERKRVEEEEERLRQEELAAQQEQLQETEEGSPGEDN